MGGENFGSNNLTPSGNDQGNPPQNAGEGNAYFRRTQPAEEHPEDENFIVKEQGGAPGNNQESQNIPGPQELPDQQKVGKSPTEGFNRHPHEQEKYREGTADEDGPKWQRPE